MARLTTAGLTKGAKINTIYVNNPAIPLDDSSLSAIEGIEQMDQYEKLYELSKGVTERAKMTPSLLKFCDNIMSKPNSSKRMVFKQCNIRMAIATGDLFYKKRTDIPWPYAGRFGY